MPRFKLPRDHTPLEGGGYLISLANARRWYVKYACTKGKENHETEIEVVIHEVMKKVFDHDYDRELLYSSLNLDCMVNQEADRVIEKMEFLLLEAVFGFIPDIAAHVPDHLWYVTDQLDLVIHVPDNEEDQRGIFY